MVNPPRERRGTRSQGAGGGGRGRPGGPRRGDRRGGGAPVARPAEHAYDVAVVVDRREGVRVVKVSTVERTSHRVIRVVYRVEFEGHVPIEFDRLGAARERSAGPPPERPAASAEPSETETAESAVGGAGPPEPGTPEAVRRGPAQGRA